MKYCILSIDFEAPAGEVEGFEVSYVTEYVPGLGSKSHYDIAQALLLETLEEAQDLHGRIVAMDRIYFPQCNPFIGLIDSGELVCVSGANLTDAGQEFAKKIETRFGIES